MLPLHRERRCRSDLPKAGEHEHPIWTRGTQGDGRAESRQIRRIGRAPTTFTSRSEVAGNRRRSCVPGPRGSGDAYTVSGMGSEPPPWTILFYRDAVGREPVREWLEDLEKTNPREHTSVRHHVDLLEEFGVVLEEPYTRQLSGGSASCDQGHGEFPTSAIRSGGSSS
jgi:hypothetical protein